MIQRLLQELHWDQFEPCKETVYKFRLINVGFFEPHKVEGRFTYNRFYAVPLEDYDSPSLMTDSGLILHLPIRSLERALIYFPSKITNIKKNQIIDWIIEFKRSATKVIKVLKLKQAQSLLELGSVDNWDLVVAYKKNIES